MTIFFSHGYTVDKLKPNYINAIASCNKEIFIREINGRNVEDKGYRGKDLPGILSSIRAEEFYIMCSSGNSSSSMGVFPKLDKDRLLSMITDPTAEMPLCAISVIEAFSNGCGQYNFPENQKLNQSQAILLLDTLQHTLAIDGAMFFPELHKILLQYNGENHILEYGDKPQIREMRMTLDIDDGFGRYGLYGNKDPDADVLATLNNRFSNWKANEYKGTLIPDDQSGFVYKQNPASPLRNFHFIVVNSASGTANNQEVIQPRPHWVD